MRDRLRPRLSAANALDMPYPLTELSTAPGFDASAWLSGEVMARFSFPMSMARDTEIA